MVIEKTTYTADDLWELSHTDDRRFELIDGELYEMSPAGGKHGIIAGMLFGFIWNFVREHMLGHVTAAETGYSITGDGKNVLAPDVGFIAKTRLQEVPDGFIPLAPDFAVEVVSPTDTASRVQKKLKKYHQANVPLVWFVYPESKTVNVYAGGVLTILGEEDTLSGGSVLPGFTLAIKDIF